MRIKLLKKVLVGTEAKPHAAKTVVDVDDAEGKALVTAGYAKETTEKVTPAKDAAALNAAADGGEKAKGDAPANKSK